MNFTRKHFAAQFGQLSDSIVAAGAPFVGDDQYIHVSLHYEHEPPTNTDDPYPVCYARISENEYIDKNPDWNRRRYDTRTLYSCTIRFWSDGRSYECCDETREAYRTMAMWWLKAYIRNAAGDEDAPVDDELGSGSNGPSSHYNDDDFGHRHQNDFAVIEGCDGKHDDYDYEPEPEPERDPETYRGVARYGQSFLKRVGLRF
jgi:hypothetical protein